MDRSRLLLYLGVWDHIQKAMTARERDEADAYAGPDRSYPLYKSGKYIASDWEFANHADDPEAVRRNILSFAREHRLIDHLPADAQYMANVLEVTRKAFPGGEWPKLPTREELDKLLNPQPGEKPEDATVTKAQEPAVEQKDAAEAGAESEPDEEDEGPLVAKSILVMKAWQGEDEDVFVEGWVSTEDRDQYRDIVPPEVFADSLNDYMLRAAPLSRNHDIKEDPIGHMQRMALVRDGQIFMESAHPSDPAEFEHFPATGTGLYGRGVVNNAKAASQVMKGNMAGFSWIGRLKEYEPLPDGGKKYGRIDPLVETTLAAYPVNTKARMLSRKPANKSTKE